MLLCIFTLYIVYLLCIFTICYHITLSEKVNIVQLKCPVNAFPSIQTSLRFSVILLWFSAPLLPKVMECNYIVGTTWWLGYC